MLHHRKISFEMELTRDTSDDSLKDVVIAIVITCIMLSFYLYNLKAIPRPFIGGLVCLVISSMIIQYMISKGKTLPSFYITNNSLTANELLPRVYDLTALQEIHYDGFNEVYITRFANKKRLKFNSDDFNEDQLRLFLAVMITKSPDAVQLSDNIKNEIESLLPAAKSSIIPGLHTSM